MQFTRAHAGHGSEEQLGTECFVSHGNQAPHILLGWRDDTFVFLIAPTDNTDIRVRRNLQSASGSGAALCRKLRASSRRPHGHIQPSERTQNWIKTGGKVKAEGRDPGIAEGGDGGSFHESPTRFSGRALTVTRYLQLLLKTTLDPRQEAVEPATIFVESIIVRLTARLLELATGKNLLWRPRAAPHNIPIFDNVM